MTFPLQFYGRSFKGALVGRSKVLWSVDQRSYGRSTRECLVGRPETVRTMLNGFRTKLNEN